MLTLLLGIGIQLQAQSERDMRKNPLWIEMIQDSNVNYFQAQKAYELFWQNHEKPEEEERMMGAGKDEVSEHLGKLSRREMKAQRLLDYYRYHCKRFEHWLEENAQFVREDGTLIGISERQLLFEKQRQER